MDTIQDYFLKQGYDSWSHKGGLLTNSEGHYVKIYFRPTESIKLIKVNK